MPVKMKLELCTPAELVRLHEASLYLLEKKGIIYHEPKAVELLKKHGAKVDGKIVHIPPKMVENALSTCPSTFKWQAQNEKHSLVVGDGPLFGTNASSVNVIDLDHVRRPSTLNDLRNIIKSCQSSDIVSFVTGMVVEATDTEAAHRHLYATYEILKHLDKPFNAYNILPNGDAAAELLDMVEIAFGPLSSDKFVTLLSATPSSPLQFGVYTLQSIIEFAKRGQPVAISPCALAGVSCPIDHVGAALLQNVEILAGLTLVQLVNPGTPVVYHVSNHNTNFKAVTSAWGSPEYALMFVPNLQLASDVYHLPTRVCVAPTTAKSADYMAAIEGTQGTFMAVLGGTHLVYCANGSLENLLTYSYEKSILDEEIFSRAKKVYDGIEFTEETLSIDVIEQVGHGGSYLTHPSTMRKFRKSWAPTVSNYDLNDESKADIMLNANKIFKKRLANAPESLISPDMDRDLMKYLNKKINRA